eukprot:309275-Amphidinium_carterae.1
MSGLLGAAFAADVSPSLVRGTSALGTTMSAHALIVRFSSEVALLPTAASVSCTLLYDLWLSGQHACIVFSDYLLGFTLADMSLAWVSQHVCHSQTCMSVTAATQLNMISMSRANLPIVQLLFGFSGVLVSTELSARTCITGR